MPSSVRVHASADLRGVVQDLDSVQLGLGREIGLAVLAGAETVAAAVPQFTPFDPNHRETRADHLPHLRETFTPVAPVKRSPRSPQTTRAPRSTSSAGRSARRASASTSRNPRWRSKPAS
jgi:hypothetical protein